MHAQLVRADRAGVLSIRPGTKQKYQPGNIVDYNTIHTPLTVSMAGCHKVHITMLNTSIRRIVLAAPTGAGKVYSLPVKPLAVLLRQPGYR